MLVETTHAMSVLYECIQAIIAGDVLKILAESDEYEATKLAALCVSKLRQFIEDEDQNRKYGISSSFSLIHIYDS
jgi:AP-3 complex subunit delta-1